jgi:hypothetical protein
MPLEGTSRIQPLSTSIKTRTSTNKTFTTYACLQQEVAHRRPRLLQLLRLQPLPVRHLRRLLLPGLHRHRGASQHPDRVQLQRQGQLERRDIALRCPKPPNQRVPPTSVEIFRFQYCYQIGRDKSRQNPSSEIRQRGTTEAIAMASIVNDFGV